VDKNQDDLARVALERNQSSQQLAQSYHEQVQDQAAQVEILKSALLRLEQKLAEAKSKKDMLLARHRRSMVTRRANRAQQAMGDRSKTATFERLKDRVMHSEAASHAETELLSDDVGEKLAKLEHEDDIERMLAELKSRRSVSTT